MIITDQFVILNFPKTGSTFVREVVGQLYQNRNKTNSVGKLLIKLGFKSTGFKELLMPHPTIPNYKDQHGTFTQIPKPHQEKHILSVVRNPYNRFDSQYRFKWWAQHPPLPVEVINSHFPTFPDISLDEFVLLRKLVSENLKTKYQIPDDIKIGDQTIQFMEMFFKNPTQVLRNLSNDYINSGLYKNDICKLTLLQQENLNEQLILFLNKYGFSDNELSFIRKHEKVNVTSTGEPNQIRFTETVINYVKTYEWILFKILSDLGINYLPPK